MLYHLHPIYSVTWMSSEVSFIEKKFKNYVNSLRFSDWVCNFVLFLLVLASLIRGSDLLNYKTQLLLKCLCFEECMLITNSLLGLPYIYILNFSCQIK